MSSLDKILAYLTKGFLLATFIIPPFVVVNALFFPFVSARVYVFRLLVEISLFFWLLLIARRPEYRPRFKNPVVLGTLVFLLGLIITALFGVDVRHSFFSNIERADGIVQFAHWVLYFLMVSSVFRSLKDWKIFLWSFIGVAFWVAAYAWKLHEPRLAGFFNNPSYLAGFMIFAIGITAVVWVMNSTGKNRRWWGILFGALISFFTATLIFTQTRGAYLGLVAGFILFTILAAFLLRKTKPKLVLATGAISLLVVLGLVSIFVFKNSSIVTGNQILNRIADVSTLTNSAAVRERYLGWIIAVESFKEKPVFGWGPENYDIAFNHNYKFLAAKDEAWFDSSHNQLFDTLAEGGIVGFLPYLLWIGAIFYASRTLFGRGSKTKLIGAILASTYLAFIVQGWFLFDTFPMYLGLFPMLGFLYYKYEETLNSTKKAASQIHQTKGGIVFGAWQLYALALFLIFLVPYLIFKDVWQPYRANHLIYEYQAYLNASRFQEAGSFLKEASTIDSPFTNFDVGNQSSWSLLYVLDNPIPQQSKGDAYNLYQLVLAREEKSFGYRPLEPQVYYVLGRMYKDGFTRFGIADYPSKAEQILKEGRVVSPDRAEYVNELTEVLLLENKHDEAEKTVIGHASKIGPPYSYMFIGHLYFIEKKYDLALENYKKAEASGFPIWQNGVNYSRYVFAAQEVKDFRAILEVSQAYVAHKGHSADALFNEAVASYYLGDRAEARKAYLEAVAIDKSYEQYAQFFIGQ